MPGHGESQAYVDLLTAVPPRVLTYAALALVLGAALWRLWLVPRSDLPAHAGPQVAARARSGVALVGGLGAAAGLAAAAWTLAVQLGTLGGDAPGADGSMVADLVWRTRWGRAWLAQALAFAAATAGYWVARREERRAPLRSAPPSALARGALARGAPARGALARGALARGALAREPAAPRRRGWAVALAGGLAAAALQGALGHAAASGDSTPLALALAAVHVIAAAAWLGTLAVMAGAWRLLRDPAREAADRDAASSSSSAFAALAPARAVAPQLAAFFPLALAAAAATALAGAGNAWLRLGGAEGDGTAATTAGADVAARLAALAGTGYGRLLLAKLAFAAAVAGAGAVNAWGWGGGARHRATARGRPAPDVNVAALDRTTRAELLVAAVVFALSAALAVSSPPGTE